uniref:Carboxylesterase type B domain-containing protein n=1 Tax=Gasterosteus aculeatus aculeatus TaxID=481459 RepID=A0AAQ4RE48_GASAC
MQDVALRIPLNVDGVFLTKPVDELYQTHELLTIPFMTGVNSDEGGWSISSFFAPPNWTEGMDWEHVENLLFMFYPDPKDMFFRDLITDEYTGRGEDRLKNRDAFTKIIGDMMFTIPAIKTANAHRVACDEVEEQLSRIMMSYWGNFARTRCPNGDGLVLWPKYGAEEGYLSIDAKEQTTGHHLKKDQFVFLTQTLPEKSREYKEKLERNEL